MITAIGDVLREAYKRGWITTRDGNISVRRGKSFYISPSGWRKTIIHPEHILKAKIQNYNKTTLEWADGQGSGKPSGELEMHKLLQTIDFTGRKARSVVHLHPTNIIAAMHAGFDLQKIASQFPEVSRYTKVGPTVPTLPVVSPELAEATFQSMTIDVPVPQKIDVLGKFDVAELSDVETKKILFYDIVGQKSHGVCAIGCSPWDAFEHIERLEHICQIVLASGVKP